MACINCPTQEEPTQVTPVPGAVSPAVSPVPTGGQFYTARQFIGGAGFDSPFDVPTPTLEPVPAPVIVRETPLMRLARMTRLPMWALAVIAAVIAYLIYDAYLKKGA